MLFPHPYALVSKCQIRQQEPVSTEQHETVSLRTNWGFVKQISNTLFACFIVVCWLLFFNTWAMWILKCHSQGLYCQLLEFKSDIFYARGIEYLLSSLLTRTFLFIMNRLKCNCGRQTKPACLLVTLSQSRLIREPLRNGFAGKTTVFK